MTDEPLDPSRLLASAALDDEVTPNERAQVDASAELLAEVAFFAALRTRLADVEVPATARETAIAAALATLDQPGDGEAVTSTDEPQAPVVSIDDRRRRQYRWVAGAAAAVVVAIVGVGLLMQNRNDDDMSTTFAPNAATAGSEKELPALAATSGGATETAETAAGDDTSAGAATAATSAAAQPSGAEAPDLTAIESAAAVSPWFAAPSFDSADQLAEFVASPSFSASGTTITPTPQPPAGSAAPGETSAPVTTTAAAAVDDATAQRNADSARCGIDTSMPSAFVVFAGQNVVVVRDDDSKQAIVYEPDTCRVVATIDLS